MLHVDRATDLLVAVCYDRREAILDAALCSAI